MRKNRNHNIGKYGHLRLNYLTNHHRGTYTCLLSEGELNEHLYAIDGEAKEMLDQIITNSIEDSALLEKLKAEDQMKWVQMMNNIKSYAEEIGQIKTGG